MKNITDLQLLFDQAYADAITAGVPVPPAEEIYVLYNQRIGRSWGNACKWENCQYRFKIKLSVILCQHTDDKAIKNTIIHELVHCAGAWDHRRLFRAYAAKINARFPDYYHVSRLTSAEEKMGVEGINNTYKYVIKCPRCGHLWGYNRLTHAVRNPGHCWCPMCTRATGSKVFLVREK